jgi:hypothetical protein
MAQKDGPQLFFLYPRPRAGTRNSLPVFEGENISPMKKLAPVGQSPFRPYSKRARILFCLRSFCLPNRIWSKPLLYRSLQIPRNAGGFLPRACLPELFLFLRRALLLHRLTAPIGEKLFASLFAGIPSSALGNISMAVKMRGMERAFRNPEGTP